MKLMRFLVFLFFSFCALQLSAQSDSTFPEKPDDMGCIDCTEELPHFPGGEAAFQNFLKANLQYPDSAKKYGRDGTVYVSFLVNIDGSLDSFRVIKGVKGAPELSDEALRVLRLMPNWIPGKIAGNKPVAVAITVPVRFVLE